MQSMVILVDSSSIHNFLGHLVVQLVNCRLKNVPTCKPKWPMEPNCRVKGSMKKSLLKFKVNFPASFHVLRLRNCNIVLGIQWLRTLGRIIVWVWFCESDHGISVIWKEDCITEFIFWRNLCWGLELVFQTFFYKKNQAI